MPEQFKTGDIVQLNSGGPAMRVKKLELGQGYTGQYQCQSFGGKKLESGYFPPESLKRVKVDGE